ncbi:conserved hypothetical protein [Verticillium alfalfae VaMs.102]|uniref:Uncharacterized protein n=1 Tax=Verticillium alfalfae (strain VaMs.102 / ATCC MYA-4576 / FGSC 10136) TaxID=526221 RepID=C9SCZ5_VERA1|nr:conserved hypothetical protein [Verticillium alfalfae VaMs.102]EEY16960.1 conserved hypothetical protein [Verticillium alfalfae VaMs.102]
MSRTTRKSTPRVRTGCQTCRRARKCDGYAARTPSSVLLSPQTSDDEVAGRRSPLGLAAIKAYSIPFRMPGSQRDRQLLHYFCVQGANEFAGFVPNEFWSRTALYASQNETIVRQSLIALSALHLDLSNGGADRAARTLLAQHGVLQMLLSSKVPDRPQVFGEVPNRTAEGLVQLCDDVLRLDVSGPVAEAAATAGPAPKSWTLSSETGVVVPLFLVAMKCADERVTARAVELLAASKRREGLYDAVAVASLVGQLKCVMNQRRQQSEELGLGSSQEDALEHWVADLLDQAPGGPSTMTAMLD